MKAEKGGASILMATYNGAKYLSEQLESILSQASELDEIIVADDCSSDGTLDILADYSSRYANVTVINNARNAGVRATFELLLSRCTKDIVILSDQDDIWIEGRKARMVEALGDGKCMAVLANSLVYTDGEIRGLFFSGSQEPDVNSVWRNFIKNNFIGCCMAFRGEVLKVALPFPPTISMHDWWIGTCAMAIGEVRYMAAPALLYRRHSTNLSPSTRRSWPVLLKDRCGNLLALALLRYRVMRIGRR